MVGQNRAAIISQMGAWSTPKITPGKSIDFAGAIDAWNKGSQIKEQREKDQLEKERRNAYIDAINGGNQEEIDKAFANYDPETYAKVMMGRQDADTQFARQKELAQMNFGNQLALENVRNQNAIGLKKLALDLKNQTDAQSEQDSLAVAQKGINQLAQVGKDNNIGVFTDWRRKHGLTDWFGNNVETDMGKIASAVAAVAPRAISQLKKAGVSGINTKGEFMQYIGLPENATSKQILGALPMMADIAGVKNPLAQTQATSATQAGDPLGLR